MNGRLAAGGGLDAPRLGMRELFHHQESDCGDEAGTATTVKTCAKDRFQRANSAIRKADRSIDGRAYRLFVV
jgi:hypothetical protein